METIDNSEEKEIGKNTEIPEPEDAWFPGVPRSKPSKILQFIFLIDEFVVIILVIIVFRFLLKYINI